MNNTGIIIVMAYPETIVMVADEWYSPLLRYIGIGKKDYLRAGHAALVLIDKERGDLEYHDFGRYITAEPNGRVRGVKYDRELDFPLKAKIKDGKIENLEEILAFLSTHPELTHGEGKLIASVCDKVDYAKAKSHIVGMQEQGAIRYAAFMKDASNCARFVTTTLVASVTDKKIRKKLVKSQQFTPSTVGNVVLGDTNSFVYEVDQGDIKKFDSSVSKINREYFLDKLPSHVVNYSGTLNPIIIEGLHENAQWLSGIAAGAWYELTKVEALNDGELRFRRIAPNGRLDIDAVFASENGFALEREFKVVHNSNCFYCNVEQDGKRYKLKYLRDF